MTTDARTPETVASSECPYCYVDTPHQHFIDRKGHVRDFIDPNKVVARTAEGEATAAEQKARESRERIATALERYVDDRLLSAMGTSQRWKSACRTCRMFNDELLRGAGLSVAMYAADRQYGMVKRGNDFYCPDCNTCVWSDER